ncbi:hypothetical protein KDK_80560 [Dictyobacter kobayashii]|uniref:Uncharacterized protein n=1 Tax=Dictyobacter kobayashii TaxID=2014872 RepID=A0A402AYS1_9CHLR|nr:hypothetical protein KDK_80560 [Dictyobacter kobayashii]
MVKAIDFTPQEWETLRSLPFVVAGTSLAVIHISAFKAVKAALSINSIVHDTSTQFPDNELIQDIIGGRHVDHPEHDKLVEENQSGGKEAAIALRNSMSEQAINILNQKNQPHVSQQYKQWLLLISREVMHKAEAHGFLGLGKDKSESEVSAALQDYSRVLQLSE